MAFTSQLRPREFVVDDDNYRRLAPPQDIAVGGEWKTRGLIPRDFARVPHGSMPFAAKFDVPVIPRSEWVARIEEMERTRTRLSDVVDAAGLKSLDQNGTNYCWCNAVVTAIMTLRAAQNQPFVALSPASVAAPIKNFRNQGGWGGEALAYIVEHGVAAQEFWPANYWQSRKYETPATQANRALHKVAEWWDLVPQRFEQLMTCLFLRVPVPIGLNWWSHEVCAMDPVVLANGGFGVRIRNSWGDGYGDHGFAVLSESRATPDDAVAPRVTTAGRS
jgi:hypothetical protein